MRSGRPMISIPTTRGCIMVIELNYCNFLMAPKQRNKEALIKTHIHKKGACSQCENQYKQSTDYRAALNDQATI